MPDPVSAEIAELTRQRDLLLTACKAVMEASDAASYSPTRLGELLDDGILDVVEAAVAACEK